MDRINRMAGLTGLTERQWWMLGGTMGDKFGPPKGGTTKRALNGRGGVMREGCEWVDEVIFG
jgi:hypothetical protein